MCEYLFIYLFNTGQLLHHQCVDLVLKGEIRAQYKAL